MSLITLLFDWIRVYIKHWNNSKYTLITLLFVKKRMHEFHAKHVGYVWAWNEFLFLEQKSKAMHKWMSSMEETTIKEMKDLISKLRL